MFCLTGSLCYLEMTEESKECDEMFNEVDDGEWGISDDNDDDFLSDSRKEYDNFKPLSANPTKWSNTLKQFVGKLATNCLSVFDHFVKLTLKGLRQISKK